MMIKKYISALLCFSLVFCSLSFFSLISSAQDEVFEYAVKYNGNYYKAFDYRLSWDEAKERCEEYGGHLVTINTPEEDEFVFNYLISKRIYGAWIGCINEGDCWRWVTNEEFDYKNFADSEDPGLETGDEINSIPGYTVQGIKTMTAMYFEEYTDGKWHMYDEGTLTYPYICEWESIGAGYEYDIMVTDSTSGDALSGAQVSWEDKTYIIPQNGVVSIIIDDSNAESIYDFFINITNQNYILQSIPIQNLMKDSINQVPLNFRLELIQNESGRLIIDDSNRFLSGFSLSEMSVSVIKSGFLNTNLKIFGASTGELSGSDKVVTGTKFRLYEGLTQAKEYEAVIYGDCDCDGKIDANDSLIAGLVADELLSGASIGRAAYEACDANADGVVDSIDAAFLFEVGLFLKSIEQNRN